MDVTRFFILALALAVSASAAAPRPNILLIFTDDQGINDVGCYGSEIPTPNIDRIAREGIRFTEFYSASAICTPSRYGLLTGRNPSRSRDQLLGALMFMAEEHRDKGIRPEEATIATALQGAGYHTALIGKWHLGHGDASFLPTRHGFDHFVGHTGGCIDFFSMTYGITPDWYHQETHVPENGYATDLITEEAVEYLANRKDGEDPFFLYLAYNAPHFGKGYSPKDEAPVNIMQPHPEAMKRVANIDGVIRRQFAAMTVSLDDGVGRVLEALDTNGLADETLVIFLTDHGGDPAYGGSNKPLRGDKATLFEGGIKVPCVMRWPGKTPPGTEVRAPMWSLDFFPTFCKLGGVEDLPPVLDGRDFSRMFHGESETVKPRALFWELGAHEELERRPWSAVRLGQWKFVSTPEDGEFLFNLADDPNEQSDLAGSQRERFAAMRALRDQLSDAMRKGS